MIKLKISIETLAVIHRISQGIYTAQPTGDFTEKLWRSIAFEVVEKIEAKCKAVVKKSNNLFEARDKITMSLKYHEAWALKELLYDLKDTAENEYQKTMNSKVMNFLDQQTA